MGKYIYVWAISTKQDNLWIKWVNDVYITEDDWWDYVPKTEASWYRRRVCVIKEKLQSFYTNVELQAMPKYSVKAVYEKMKGEQPKKEWGKCIWNRLSFPKHKFVFWLAIQKKLQTTARLVT